MKIKHIIIAIALMPIAFLLFNEVAEHRRETRAMAIASYLSQPKFTSKNMLEQLSGVKGARLELLDLNDSKAYISVPGDWNEQVAKRLTILPRKVERAEKRFGQTVLGPIELLDESRSLVRFAAKDMRVDDCDRVRIPYGNILYDPTAEELTRFLTDAPLYRGDAYAVRRSGSRISIFANHSALVARKEESLERLAKRITQGATKPEERIQKLLTFVTDDIEYDELDATRGGGLLKRPSEVLLTGRATCSGKTILFASLLEQIGQKYLLAYMPAEPPKPGHIAVLVRGNFPDANHYSVPLKEVSYGNVKTPPWISPPILMHADRPAGNFQVVSETAVRYHYAETTAEGFRIGESRILEENPIERLELIQQPGEAVINMKTGLALEMVKDTVLRR